MPTVSPVYLARLSDVMRRCNLNKLTLGVHLCFLLFFMVQDSLSITMPLFFESRNMSIAYLVVPVSRVHPSRKLTVVGMSMVVGAVSLMLALGIGHNWGLAIAFFLVITTTSVFNVVMNPLLAANTSESRLGITYGVRDVFLYFGGFLGVLITGQLLGLSNDNYGLVFIGYVGLLLILSFILQCGLPTLKIRLVVDNASESKTHELRGLAGLDRRFIHYLAVNVLITLATTSLVYAVLRGRQLGMENAGIYMLFSSHVLLAAVLSLFGGILIDRFDKKSMYVVSTFLYVLVFICLSIDSPVLFVFAVMLLGVQAALANISNAYLFSVFRGHDVNRYWGVLSFVSLVFGSLGMITFGSLWEAGLPIFHLSLPIIIVGFLLNMNLPRKVN